MFDELLIIIHAKVTMMCIFKSMTKYEKHYRIITSYELLTFIIGWSIFPIIFIYNWRYINRNVAVYR